jgi:peptide/nickel transport system substrate-binding protein
MAATACASGNTGPSGTNLPKAGGAVTIRVTSDWDTLDPHNSVTFIAQQIHFSMYDRLIHFDPATNKLEPWVATSWKETNGSMAFTIRNDVVCSDGTKVDAQVVADSFKRYYSFLGKNTGIAANFGTGSFSETVTDPTHLTISWTSGYTDMAPSFALVGIVCPAGLKAGADFEHNSYGSGPFVLTTATHGVAATMKVHQGWTWGPGGAKWDSPGFPDTVTFRIVNNDTTAANSVTSGGLDITDVSGSDIDRLAADKSLKQVTLHAWSAQPISFNEEPGHATSDDVLREALMYAIDQKAYQVADSAGHGVISSSIFTKDAPCYDPSTAQLLAPYDMNKAKSTLSNGGYTLTGGKLMKDGKQVNLTIIGSTGENAGPEYLRNQFAQLGINVDLQVTDFTSMVQKLFPGKFDIVIVQTRFLASPQTWISNYVGKAPTAGGTNWGRNINPEAATAAEDAKKAPIDQKCKFYATVQQALLKHHDSKPAFAPAVYWYSKNVQFKLASLYSVDLTTVRRTTAA